MTNAEKDALIEALLAERGRQAISKAEGLMPGLMEYRRRYDSFQPLHGARIAGCTYFDAKTAVLIETLIALGAEVQWTNPGYTYNKKGQNAVASALKQADVLVNLWNDQTDSKEEEAKRTAQFPNETWANMVVDENGMLMSCLSDASSVPYVAPPIGEYWKGLIETPKNVCELVAKAKLCSYDLCEYSLVQYIKEVTDKLPAPENVCVVIGYNARGKSCARALRSIGVEVLICVIDPIPALHVKHDGFTLLSLQQACKRAKVFVFALNLLEPYVDFIGKMKDNSMICNISAIDYNVDWLKKNAEEVESSEIYLARYKLENGNHVELLNLHRLDRVLERYTNAVSYTYTLWLLTLIHISKKLNSEEPISLPDDLEEQAALLM